MTPALRMLTPLRAAHVRLDGSELPDSLFGDDSELPDSLFGDDDDNDMGLLKYAHETANVLCTCTCSLLTIPCPPVRRMPRLTTPDRAGFERYRQRQQDRTGAFRNEDPLADMAQNGPKKTPLGLDPVEGEPIDLTQLVDADGEFVKPSPPSADQIAKANDDFEQRAKGPVPEGFAEGLEGLIDPE